MNYLKVVMVSGGGEPIPPLKGGAIDSYAYNLSIHLASRDLVFLFANHRSTLETQGNLIIKKIIYPNTRNFYFDYAIFNFHTLLEFKKLKRVIDIVHTNLSTTTLFILPFFKNVVFTSHSSGWWRPYSQHRKQIMAVRKAKAVVAISQFIKKQMEKYRKDKENIFYIPNGVDIHFFRPKEHSFRKILLTVGSISERKGMLFLLKALKDIVKIDKEIKLFHIGGIQDWYYYLSLLKFIQRNNLWNNVTFLGRVGIDKLLYYYQTADIFVLPSLAEGMPFSVLEAMSCALPIISTQIGGVEELVVNGENGILVPPKNVDKLKSAIERLVFDEKVARKMGKLSRKRIVRNFSWEVITRKIRDVYELVIDI